MNALGWSGNYDAAGLSSSCLPAARFFIKLTVGIPAADSFISSYCTPRFFFFPSNLKKVMQKIVNIFTAVSFC
jgi:hypothetical protein